MITKDNIFQVYPKLDQKLLPKLLQAKEFKFLEESMEYYNEDEDIQKLIDKFIEKLNNQLKLKGIEVSDSGEITSDLDEEPKEKQPVIDFIRIPDIPKFEKEKGNGKSTKKAKEQKTKFKIGQDLYWFDNDGKLIKERIKYISFDDDEPVYLVFSVGHTFSYTESQIVMALKEKRMFLERPPKPVAKLAPDVAFIKRYITMNGKTKTKPQIVAFIKSLQKAIVEQVIRKTSEHSDIIMNIQDELLKCHKLMGNDIDVTIDPEKYIKYKAIVDGLEVHPAVKLIKRFIALFGVQDEKIKAQRAEQLLCTLEKQMEQLQKDPTYGKAIADMYDTLEHYLDKESDLTISEQQLNGLMGLAGMKDGLGNAGAFFAATASNFIANIAANAINGKAKPTPLSGTQDTILLSTDIVKMEFQTLNFDGKFKDLIGNPSINFTAMVYGMPGSGKTTLCILFAKYLAEKFSKKVLFATIEEGINHTFKEKLTRLHAYNSNIIVSNHLPKNMNGIDAVFIDSVNAFNLSAADLNKFKKQYPNKILIEILQCTKDGKFKGSQEYEHDVDVVICVENGIASSIGHKNRFGKSGEMEVW